MPLNTVRREISQWPRLAGAFFAPAGRIIYDEQRGAAWSK
jgi:hypothetical protein